MVEHWSPKPGVGSSSLSSRARRERLKVQRDEKFNPREVEGSLSSPVEKIEYIMITYIKESFEELKNNVVWLDRERASNLMVVVAVFSILFALATWGVDSTFQ